LTPATREFLVRLDELVDGRDWPELDREIVRVGTGDAAALVRLPHRTDHGRDVEVEIDDRRVVVRYGPESIAFTGRNEALHFVDMLGSGRVELLVRRGPLWTTMTSHRDGQSRPFRRTRMPWPALRPRIEHHRFGFRS
jgi:hypothetical protein